MATVLEETKGDDMTSVQRIELEELQDGQTGKSMFDHNLELIRHVKVRIGVSVGAAEMTVAELLGLKVDSIIKLDKGTDDPVDVFLDDRLIARGRLVVVGDSFGVNITEIKPASGS